MELFNLVRASEALGTTRSRSAKTRLLADLLAQAPHEEVGLVAGFLVGALRQGRVGIGWSMLGGTRGIPPATEPSLSVDEVDDAIGRIERATGPGSAASRRDVVAELFGRATAAEGEFLRRLLIGELRHGALEGVMADAIALASGVPPATVRRAAMLAGDLSGVAAIALSEGEAGLARIGLELLRPVLPMLAATSTSVAEALAANGRSSVEWKLDGARLQVHRSGGEVRLFTRSLLEVTDQLPEIAGIVRGLPASQVILDGEVFGAGFDAAPIDAPIDGAVDAPIEGAGDAPIEGAGDEGPTGIGGAGIGGAAIGGAGAGMAAARAGERVELFQDTMSRFSRRTSDGADRQDAQGAEGAATLQVRFFDILHLNGNDLIDLPLGERIEVLGRVAGPYRVPGIVTEDVARAEHFAADALARGHEGVMVKSVASLYEAGRRGSSWRKVKPVRTVDLVVLAAEWGHGRRHGWLSNLHLGARDPASGGFVMVGKTFKGLTDILLAWQTERLLGLETGRDGITVHVRPEVVVEIALDGVQRSPRYPGGVALRFARVKRYRPDKTAAQADTIETVRSLLPGDAAGHAAPRDSPPLGA